MKVYRDPLLKTVDPFFFRIESLRRTPGFCFEAISKVSNLERALGRMTFFSVGEAYDFLDGFGWIFE